MNRAQFEKLIAQSVHVTDSYKLAELLKECRGETAKKYNKHVIHKFRYKFDRERYIKDLEEKRDAAGAAHAEAIAKLESAHLSIGYHLKQFEHLPPTTDESGQKAHAAWSEKKAQLDSAFAAAAAADKAAGAAYQKAWFAHYIVAKGSATVKEAWREQCVDT